MIRYVAPLYREESEIAKIAMESALAQKVAEQVLTKAQQLARAEGETQFAESLHIETGVRPKGRPFIQVVADDPLAERTEFGDTNTTRRRILGRAAGVTIYSDQP